MKQNEDRWTSVTIGIYQNKHFFEVAVWINEVDKFLKSALAVEALDKSLYTNSNWCNYMISRIRDLCAKRGPNFTFGRLSDVGSSSINMVPLSLREELYYEIASLINIYYAQRTLFHSTNDRQLYKPKDALQRINEVDQFLEKVKVQLLEKIPETNSDWYRNKIAETRTMIDKCEPAFISLQSSQDVEPAIIKLHEELRCEIRLLINLQCVDLKIITDDISDDPYVGDRFKKELQEQINEMNKFLTEINLQLKETTLMKSSDWYTEKIAETRMLIAKRYSAFPFQSQDVGSSSINMPTAELKAQVDDLGYTRQQYQIFLSFRGEDTRYGFTWNLYEALKQEGFKVFMDDEGLQRGDSIAQVLMETIENSKLSIIVFSQNYADSTWCLNELAKIVECKQKKNQLVWPIFYKVEPSDVRHQRNSYEKAMIKQETRFGKDSENVKKWRSSLSQICNLKAFHYKENSGYERFFIQDIIKDAINIRDRL
ncbi:uncharacterized protein LOC130733192 isoform X2 [Lotus japonicus]|nr:uncharacterized protein LOC130733192 isoform X2 [Lotus japonicus]